MYSMFKCHGPGHGRFKSKADQDDLLGAPISIGSLFGLASLVAQRLKRLENEFFFPPSSRNMQAYCVHVYQAYDLYVEYGCSGVNTLFPAASHSAGDGVTHSGTLPLSLAPIGQPPVYAGSGSRVDHSSIPS